MDDLRWRPFPKRTFSGSDFARVAFGSDDPAPDRFTNPGAKAELVTVRATPGDTVTLVYDGSEWRAIAAVGTDIKAAADALNRASRSASQAPQPGMEARDLEFIDRDPRFDSPPKEPEEPCPCRCGMTVPKGVADRIREGQRLAQIDLGPFPRGPADPGHILSCRLGLEPCHCPNIASTLNGQAPVSAAAPAEAPAPASRPAITPDTLRSGAEAQAATLSPEDRFWRDRIRPIADGLSITSLNGTEEPDDGGPMEQGIAHVASMVRGCARCRRVVYEPTSRCSGCGDYATSFTPEAGEGYR